MIRIHTALAKDSTRTGETGGSGTQFEDAQSRVVSIAPVSMEASVEHIRVPTPDPRQVYDLRRIAKRYELRSMSGTDAVRLASELVAIGFEEADALALTLPISSRNLMSKMGKTSRAPRIETWTDLMLHHVQHLHSARGVDHRRLDQLARMVALSEVLSEAEQPR